MDANEARAKAEELIASVPGGNGYYGRLYDAIARALLLAQAEALNELVGRFGALPANGPMGHSDQEAFKLRDALRRAAEEMK